MAWSEKDFEQYKEFINKLLYEIMTLDDYEIVMNRMNAPSPNKSNSSCWMYKTLCHNVDLHKCKNNLAFYTENKSFYCFSECQVSYNLITLLEKRFELIGEPKTRFQCVKFICECLNIPFNFKSNVEKSNTNKYNWESSLGKYIRQKNGEIEFKTYDKSILDYFENTYSQNWIDDNISIDSMEKYCIKYYNRNDSIVIPCFDDNGDMIGIRQRFLNPNNDIKYLPLEMINGDTYKFSVNGTLYGLNYNKDNISHYKKVVLGEAEKFTLQCDTYFACKNYSVSLYGKSMSQQKAMKLLKLGVEEVIIALDFDYEKVYNEDGETFTSEFESFKKNIYRIGEYFRGHCRVTAMISYDGHSKNDSPTDNGKEKYLELFNNREDLYEWN